jgi:hypothetical protein
MQMRVEALEVITPGVKSDYNTGFGFFQHLVAFAVGLDATGHVAAKNPVDDASHFTKQAPVFEEPLAKPHLPGETKDYVAMRDLREPLEEMNRRSLGLPRYATWANSSLTGKRYSQTYIAGAALEQDNPEVRVTALLKLEKRLLHFSAGRPMSTAIAALIDGEKSLKMVREDSPERALKSLAGTILMGSAPRRCGRESNRQGA